VSLGSFAEQENNLRKFVMQEQWQRIWHSD